MGIGTLTHKLLIGVLGVALCLLLLAPAAFSVEDDGTSSVGTLTNGYVNVEDYEDITGLQSALATALTGAVSGETVTVTGTKSFDEESKILLAIPQGVTVLWQANLEAIPGDVFGSNQLGYRCVVGVEGSGTFKLESPGAIVTKDGTTGNALMFGYTNSPASGSTLIIDNGTVRADDGRAVLLYSGSITAEIGGEATVLESRGSDNSRAGALVVFAEANIITITGGTFTAASGYTIDMASSQDGRDSTLTISGGIIRQTANNAAYGALRSGMERTSVTIVGTAAILAENAKAIEISGSNQPDEEPLTIGGDTVVTAGSSQSSSFYPAIYVYGREDLHIIIKDNAKVQSFSGVQGGSTQGAISASVGQSATTGTRLTVQDNAQVYADNSNAVYLYDSYVEVKDNALIYAKDQYAVYLENVDNNTKQDEGIIDLLGGALFAYGANVSYRGDVIYCDTLNAGSSSSGVVIAWDNTPGTTSYVPGTATDLTYHPTNAQVVWALDAQKQSGIAYQQGEDSGFIPLADVTVSLIQLTIDNAVATSRSYDGTQSVATGGTLVGVQSAYGDVALAPTGTIADKNVGSGKAVIFELIGDPTHLAMYELVQPSNVSVDITPAPLSVKANDVTLAVGAALPSTWEFTVSGIVAGENLADAFSAAPVASCAVTDISRAGDWPITVTAGTPTANYTVSSHTNGVLRIKAVPDPAPDPVPVPGSNPDPVAVPKPALARTGDLDPLVPMLVLFVGAAAVVLHVARRSKQVD